MKIAIIFPKDSEAIFSKFSTRTFGGATVQLYLLAKELSSFRDHKIFSLVTSYEKIDFQDIDKFILKKTFNENDNILKKIFLFHKSLQDIKPDVIFQRGLTLLSCFMAVYCFLFRIKFIYMFAHDIESHGIYQRSRKKCYAFPLLLRFSSQLFVQNEYEQEQLSKRCFISPVKIFKKGIDAGLIKQSNIKQYDCIWIARCEKWKKPEVFIQLAEKNIKRNFLMICSKVDSDEEFFDKIKSMAVLHTNIEFLEFVEYREIYCYLSKSKVFCITSEMEGDWPMTVLEAGASGLPILSYHLNYGNIFEKYNAGFLSNGDFNLFNTQFAFLLKNKKIYKERSEGVLKFIDENHNLKYTAQKLIDYITD